MREPPLGLDEVPSESLRILHDEIQCAPTTEERLVGVYEVALPSLRDEIRKYGDETHPLADAPSRRLLRFALLEIDDMIAFGTEAINCLVTDERRAEMGPWVGLLRRGLEGASSCANSAAATTTTASSP